MTEEKVAPTMPEGEKKEPEVDVDSLVNELKAVGVTNAKELQGKLAAGSEAGKLANMLGEVRNENAQLKQMLQELKTQKPHQQEDFTYDNDQRPIDLEASLESAVEKVLTKRERQQYEIQQQHYKRWAAIQSDKDYGHVKEIWKNKTQDPEFMYEINAGLKDPLMEYQETVREFYKGLAMRAAEALSKTKGGPVNAPHTETGEKVDAPPAVTPDETTEHINALKEKTNKGYLPNEDEELDALAKILGG